MPYSLAFPFSPKYTLKTSATETAAGFAINGVSWTAQAQVRIQEPNAHQIKVGFIQVVKSYHLKMDYQNSILEWKLPSTPMCDCDPATDAPWYEASTVPLPGIGCSPEITGPCNQILKPLMGDHPSLPISWLDGIGNPVQRARRQQQFQTWIVVENQTANTWTPLYCFSYSIDQLVSVNVAKPVGSRCKVEVGASTQASTPTTYSTAPFPKIPAQAFLQQCPNTSQFSTRTVRR